jgi:hypothetical protein
VWSCSTGTTPDLSVDCGDCVCEEGYERAAENDAYGRKICRLKTTPSPTPHPTPPPTPVIMIEEVPFDTCFNVLTGLAQGAQAPTSINYFYVDLSALCFSGIKFTKTPSTTPKARYWWPAYMASAAFVNKKFVDVTADDYAGAAFEVSPSPNTLAGANQMGGDYTLIFQHMLSYWKLAFVSETATTVTFQYSLLHAAPPAPPTPAPPTPVYGGGGFGGGWWNLDLHITGGYSLPNWARRRLIG